MASAMAQSHHLGAGMALAQSTSGRSSSKNRKVKRGSSSCAPPTAMGVVCFSSGAVADAVMSRNALFQKVNVSRRTHSRGVVCMAAVNLTRDMIVANLGANPLIRVRPHAFVMMKPDGSVGSSGDKRKLSCSVQARASSSKSDSPVAQPPAIMVNSLTGKMGRATAEAVIAAGLLLVPFTLVGRPGTESAVDVMGVTVEVCHKSEREAILDKLLSEYPNLVIVDYTVPQAVNDNAEFYCRRGVPFVMGTTGGDRAKLMNDVLNSGNFAVIAPQMGKQVVAFQAAMQLMAEQFPGAFSGYNLQVTESHQSSKLDTSGTAKAVVASFVKLGLDFDVSQIEKVRDPEQQIGRMRVPETHLPGHAYHTYHLSSPDNTVSFEFQHNVCGRSIYAEGSVDAVLFLAKKIEQESDKKVYDMVDVLREGNMR